MKEHKHANDMMVELRYFNASDFKLDGQDVSGLMNQEFLIKLDNCRHLAGVPFNVTSSYRTIQKNKAVGGAPNSMHVHGRAVDIVCTDGPTRYKIVQSALSLGLTVGIMERGIHIDDRPTPTLFHYYARTKEASSLNE